MRPSGIFARSSSRLPRPLAWMFPGGIPMPRSIRLERMRSARCTDNRSLYSSVPMVSVWPMTTISGAGPAVLVWTQYDLTAAVLPKLKAHCEGWADVMHVPFEPQGADVKAM